MHPASAISVQVSLAPAPTHTNPSHNAMQSDTHKMVEALDRHYEYLAKLSNLAAADRLNEAKAKSCTRDIARLNITSDDDGAMLQDCVERGTWAEVPWGESPSFYLLSATPRPRASSLLALGHQARPRASNL